MKTEALTQRVIAGGRIEKEEALWLYRQPVAELSRLADEIRQKRCGNGFDLCTILNGKSGRCPENCRFCAQSAHHPTGVEEYPLLSVEKIVEEGKKQEAKGALRYAVVTSGRCLSEEELEQLCEAMERLHQETKLGLCVSCGLLTEEQYRRLRAAGVSRIHNNLETSERYFPQICTTHRFSDKVAAIRAAQAAGLSVCSGGIMGMGETAEDRIDLALSLRELGITSVPINLLNPIAGTPLAGRQPLSEEELRRIVAVYRFLLPEAAIRLAGGRGLLEDKGEGCFCGGANAAISGDMLTTAGITLETDRSLLHGLGYEVRLQDE